MMHGVKAIIKSALDRLIDIFVFPAKNFERKTILLIRLDAIGDYVLFRNFIEILKTSEKYKGYKITLLGNAAWRKLAEVLDGRYVSNFIWLERKKFVQSPFYRYQKFKEIVSKGYEIVISPVFNRETYYADSIVKLIKAGEKVGSAGDLSFRKKRQRNDRYYTRIIPGKQETLFEFYRNKEFFENLLDIKIGMVGPHIQYNISKSIFDLPDNYFVTFIGASSGLKKWDIRHFAKVSRNIRERYQYNAVLCGAEKDIPDAKKFRRYYGDDFVDLVGWTSLVDLLHIFSKAMLVMSNDTSAAHLAVALGTADVFVVANGSHYGRFTPYPKTITNKHHSLFPPQIEDAGEDHKKLCDYYRYGSALDINTVTADRVIKKIAEVWEETN